MNFKRLIPFVAALLMLLSLGIFSNGTVQAAIIAQINFQDLATVPPAGYLRDSGEPFGPRTGANQGAGETYGWVLEGTTSQVDMTAQGRNRGTADELRLQTLMHMQPNNTVQAGAWEYQIPNGDYTVTVSVGDASNLDSIHRINIEGVNAIDDFDPESFLRFREATINVNVNDGRLTIDAMGGVSENTKINYVIIQDLVGSLPPRVQDSLPRDGDFNVPVDTFIRTNGLTLPNGAGVDDTTVTIDTVYVYPTAGNPATDRIPGSFNDTGGADSINFSPLVPLEPNTSYTFVVTNNVRDGSGAAFEAYSATFTTGAAGGGPTSDISFTRVTASGAPATNFGYMSLDIWNSRLYATTGAGIIYHWQINPDGTLDDERTIMSLAGRITIGLAFDPASTANNPILWVSHNAAPMLNAGHFTGAVSRLAGTNVGQGGENWTRQDYITGLPRSTGDHMTNSIAFGPDGALYLVQAGNSAMGARSPESWGNQAETLLAAAVLRVNTGALGAMALPLNVATGIPSSATELPDNQNFGLGDPGLAANGLYDPQAPGAPVTLYATGLRNAYDLVWHSNGNLYIPTNGSAGGSNDNGGTARIPQMPANFATLSQCQNRVDDAIFGDYTGPFVTNIHNRPDTQSDYLFRVNPADPTGYYGHPNPTRCEWVMNGANPTPLLDFGQTGNHYPVGTQVDRNWRGHAYDFGSGISPNGVIEYQNAANFGGQLAGKLLVTRWSAGDDLITLTPGGATGNIVAAQTNIAGFQGMANPLDLVEDPATGNIYVAEFGSSNGFGSTITLLRANNITGIPNIVVTPSTTIVFSDVQNGGTSADQTITISNTGTGDLIVSDLIELGLNSDQFNIVSAPAVPVTIAPGDSVDVVINFEPTSTGVKVANLRIDSTDPDTPILLVEQRGLGTAGEGGADEPSLQAILNAFSIPVDVGDPNAATTPIGNGEAVGDYPGPLTGQEVSMQTFTAADPSQPVTFQVLGAYAIDGNPPVQFGWHPVGDAGNLNQLFSVDPGNHQTLSPATTGTLQFNPGTTEFALYSRYPPAPWNGRVVSTQDGLNTWDPNGILHKARVFPLRDNTGVIPNAFIIGFEEWERGWDYNDIVVVVRNVEIPTTVPGGLIRFENLDWTTMFANTTFTELDYLNRWLTFHRIREPLPNTPPNNGGMYIPHDQVTLRIHNDDGGEDLLITDLTISDLTEYTLPNGENPSVAAPIIVPPNGFYDLTIQFIEVNGARGTRIRNLTIESTAGNEPTADITLAGAFQIFLDGINENILPEILEVFNIQNNTAFPFDSQYIPRGEEILAPAWERADPNEPVYIRQLAAMHGCCVAPEDFLLDGPGGGPIIEHDESYNNGLLPNSNADTTQPTEGLRNPTGEFQIQVNNVDSDLGLFQPDRHGTRLWPLRNGDGVVVPNTYMVLFDYIPFGGCVYTPGAGLCDYNDNMYIVTNIVPTNAITDMDVDIATDLNPIYPNDTFTLNVTAENLTAFPAADVDVTVTLPLEFANNIDSITTDRGTCNLVGQQVECDLGTVNGLLTVNIDIAITSPVDGSFPVSADLTTTSIENSTANNDADMNVIISDPSNQPGSITIIKDATPNGNEVFAFNVTGGLTPATFSLSDDGSNSGAVFEGYFNFQPQGVNIPDGYTAETGAAYDANVGYGWVIEGTTTPQDAALETRDRNRGIMQLLDTIIHLQRPAGIPNVSWMVDVPNGTYDVTVSVGDGPNGTGIYDSTHNVNVNGVNVINAFAPNAGTEYLENTVTVTVTNGRIVVDALGGDNTKLNYINIVPVNVVTSTRIFNSVVPGTYDITETPLAGWTLTGASCVGGDFIASANGVSVTLDPGEDIICTFENTLTNGPALVINKDTTTPVINRDETASFVFTLLNVGTVQLTNFAISDPLCTPTYTGGDNGNTLLDPGETWAFVCDVPNATVDFTNTVEVTMTTLDGVTTVTDTDTVDVTVVQPTDGAITIVKDADQTVAFDGTATWTITVNNVGVGALTDVTITDALAPDCDNTFATIAEGGSETYTCTLDNVTQSFTNVIDVTATDQNTDTVTATDSAEVTVPPTLQFTSVLTTSTPVITNGGGTASFTLEMTNTGNVTPDTGSFDSGACALTLLSGDTNANNLFDPGETFTLTCDIPNVANSFTQTVTTNLGGAGQAASDTQTVDVIVTTIDAPAISIVKDDDQLINAGETANFTITVTNIGNVDLTDVTVTDALTADCDRVFPTLAIGAAETYTCAETNVAASFTNTAEVVGTTPTATTVTDSDTATVTVFVAAPSLAITKTTSTPTVGYGSDVVFDIRVENNGNVDLSNVGIIDPLTPTCAGPVGVMTVGQVIEYSCTASAVTADFTNVITVTGTTPTNATVDATDDQAVVVTINGAINIDKTPDTQTVQSGTPVAFTLTVTNTGDSPLSNITVTDATCTTGPTFVSGDANADDILQTTEAWVYSCEVANPINDFTNTAEVEGTALDNTVVADDDTATVTVTSAPVISVEKAPETQTVPTGGTATFTMTVTNTGDVPLANVTVTDPLCTTGPTLSGGDTNTDGILQTTEAWVYDCEVTNVTAPFTNTVDVTGEAPNTTVVNASDSAIVRVDTITTPTLAVDITPPTSSVTAGDSLTFTIIVANIGAGDLFNIDVTVPQCDAAPILIDGDTNGDGIMQLGEGWNYTCDATNITTGFTNVATATADDGNGNVLNASDNAIVTVAGSGAPAIAIDKTPIVQEVSSGGTANFTINVTNIGSVDLANVVVTDAQCDAAPAFGSGDDNGDSILQSTETWTYFCSTTNVTQPFVNVAEVTADGGGIPVAASNSAYVIVDGVIGSAPSIDLLVSPSDQQVISGQSATFSITVFNNGNEDLTNVVISDNISPTYANCATTFVTLAVNEVQTYECNTTPTGVDSFTASFSVTADANVITVTDAQDAVVNVVVDSGNPDNNAGDPGSQNPVDGNQQFTAFDPFVTKIADPPFAIPGEAVTFIFYVSNPGTVPAQNVVAVDPIPSEVEILSATAPVGTTTISGQDVIFSIDTLQPGETITITIETRVRDDVAVPFTITNEVCMNADNMPTQNCDTATVISVTALPATGETPLWSIILRGLLMVGGAVVVTAAAGFSGRNILRKTRA